ncbi:MAG: hypothetical protein M1454_01700 [Candidatus Thermoplasmatota archaeon]|nr:hypothetical protein [Candidatus Thermoplasmatota archaeon]
MVEQQSYLIVELIENANRKLKKVYNETPLMNVRDILDSFIRENRKCIEILSGRCDQKYQQDLPIDMQNMDHLLPLEEADFLSLSSAIRYAEKIEVDLISNIENMITEKKVDIDGKCLSYLMTSLKKISRKISILYNDMIQK